MAARDQPAVDSIMGHADESMAARIANGSTIADCCRDESRSGLVVAQGRCCCKTSW